jgi:NADPH-dependent glutamate synthase beta subunit-like oxidoreductase
MSGPKESPTIWTTGWTDVFDTGTWRAATPVHAWRPSPCHLNCPLEADAPVWISQLAQGSWREAWLSIVEKNPFPALTGRVCHHPCEAECNRTALEGAVGVKALEHFLGDLALQEGWPLPAPAPPTGRRVAVLGAGPAGLSCAYELSRHGVSVTVLEARSALGGLPLGAIPSYRLPKGIWRGEIERLLAMGISARTHTRVEDEAGLAELERTFDAVFLALGAERAKRLPHLEGGRTLEGLSLLRELAQGGLPSLGKKVAVLGGGSAAIDVARSLRRLGREVSLLFLEEREAMPAQEEEVQEATEEGVILYPQVMVDFARDLGDRLQLGCARVKLEQAALPALKPVLEAGSAFSLEADELVIAIGQDPELGALSGVLAGAPELLEVDASFATSRPGVFAAGDVASSERFVSVALGQGRKAAAGILSYLGLGPPAGSQADAPEAGAPLFPTQPAGAAVVRPENLNFFYAPPAQPKERARSLPQERLQGFSEVISALSPPEAAAEAARCLSCGTCQECDNCLVFCPDMAVKKDPARPRSYLVLDKYCKGCGLCVVECPRGVFQPREEVR